MIEDTLDTILMRSRKEAELAQLRTEAERLFELHTALSDATLARRVTCQALPPADRVAGVDTEALAVSVPACQYARGNSRVRVSSLTLHAGFYALVGPNGCGKSTLLSVLAACARSGVLHPSIELGDRCEVVVSGLSVSPQTIVEVGQRLYCPLHTAPARWLGHGQESEEATGSLATRAAKLAVELAFRTQASTAKSGAESKPLTGDSAAMLTAALADEFLKEVDDYCAGLSGGQRVKLELLRAVFLRSVCPPLLLLDEVFAPLDAASKALVMRKLKAFCTNSVVIVVYHPDDHAAAVGTSSKHHRETVCQAGRGAFFDAVLEVLPGGELTAPRGC